MQESQFPNPDASFSFESWGSGRKEETLQREVRNVPEAGDRGRVLTWLRVLMSVCVCVCGGHSCPCLLGLCGSVSRPVAQGSGERAVSLPGPELPSLWKAKFRQVDLAIIF